MEFPGGSEGKESACNARDQSSITGYEDPLEKGMATHSSILVWRIPWTEEPGRATVHGVTKSQTGLSKKGLSISIDLVTLDISCKWNHKICGLSFLACFSYLTVFTVQLC